MRLHHPHIFVNVSLYHDKPSLSLRLLQPHRARSNTSIFIFSIHKLSALIRYFIFEHCFHLILENKLYKLVIAVSILDSWMKYWCFGLMPLYMFWCGISISIRMSDIAKMSESAKILRNRNRMRKLGNKCLFRCFYTQNLRSKLTSVECLLIVFTSWLVAQWIILISCHFAICLSQRPLLSGLCLYALLLQEVLL